MAWCRTLITASISSANYNKNRSDMSGFPFPIHSHFILSGIEGPDMYVHMCVCFIVRNDYINLDEILVITDMMSSIFLVFMLSKSTMDSSPLVT